MSDASISNATASGPPLPWRRSVAWLLFLGPFFFATYGFSNWAATQRASTLVLAFDWERAIPFAPWTIVPYWSIDLLYGLSFLACRDRREVDRHALRLLTVQVVAIACFLALPMRFSFERPAVDGGFGALFAALASFDQPFNQAPSLHIALLVVIWVQLAPLLRGWPGAAGHLWLALIGVSVLTTWQHHFVDIPTGALLGFMALWAWPDEGTSPLAAAFARGAAHDRAARRRLAFRYGAGAIALGALAAMHGGAALWLLWGSVALALVSLAYAGIGADAFQKRGRRHSIAAAALFAPYTLGAWVNSRVWTRRHPAPDEIVDRVWIGRLPISSSPKTDRFAALVDLCAELPAPAGTWQHYALPWLDLVVPSVARLREAAAAIEAARARGGVLVCCALGFSRSASAVAAWMLLSGRAASVAEAVAAIRTRRPAIVLSEAHLAALASLRDNRSNPSVASST